MHHVARLSMICVLVAAPWCLAGAPLVFQPWLFGGIWVASILGILSEPLGTSFREFHRTVHVFPMLAAAVLGLAGLQLLAVWDPPALSHAVLTSRLEVFDGTAGTVEPASVYPAETRLVMARIALATSAFLGGAWLFSSNRSRRWLWSIVACNGALLVVFGLIQKATWNERIFWTLPLMYGGQPFASFINRNNAAGYLAMCLAAAIGLLLCDGNRKPNDHDDAPAVSFHRMERRSDLTWVRQSLLVIIVVLCAGILATMSRGGIISTTIALLAALSWLGGFRRWRFLVVSLASSVILGVGLIAWIGFGGQLHYRLMSLQQSFSTDGRAFHWADMLNALRDFPMLGMGFGTYRYANKPYQDHFSFGWYVNADNQYLEWLVEAGVPGLLITLACVGTLGYLCQTWRRIGSLPETLVCSFLLITQALQSFTDFGVTVTANVLTLAVLLGSLSASDIRDRITPLTAMERMQRVLAQQGARVRTICIVFTLIVVAGLGLADLTTAAAAVRFRDRLPLRLEKREQFTLVQTNAALTRGMTILNWRPDDAELHATMAQLWFHRFRLETFERMSSRAATPSESDSFWAKTELDVFFSEVCRLHAIGATDTLEDLNRDPIAAVNLEQVWRHLSLARKSCPLLPRIGILQAAVAILKGGDGRAELRREAALSPADPNSLRRIGLYADRLGDRDLYMVCLQRQLQLKPEQAEELLAEAIRRLEPLEIIARVLPRNPQSLVTIAEIWKSPNGRDAAITHAKLNLPGARLPFGYRPYLKARLAVLDGAPEIAGQNFAQAIRENPLEATWRRRYAEFLESQGDVGAAIEQAELCQALSPNDASCADLVRHLKMRLINPAK